MERLRIGGSSQRESGLEMDSDVARGLFEGGAFLILLDVPQKTEFGIDLNSWTTGVKFKGVKMIPPGLHFVYYSSRNKEGQTGMRIGFFHKFAKEEVLVKRWDPVQEILIDERDTTDLKAFCDKENLKNFDRNLGAYPYDNWKKWISLTNSISEDTLNRLEPRDGLIYSATQLIPNEYVMKSMRGDNDLKSEEPSLPDLKIRPGTNIRYTPIPTKCPKGASPSDITKNCLDTSFQLESFLSAFNILYGDQVSSSMSTNNHVNEVLAEVQFSFICFLVGQHFDSFEQWKNLITMLCSCDDAISKYPDLFFSFITDLHFQIREVPDDFFVDIVASNNFLVSVLTRIFSTVRHDGDSIPLRVKRKFIKFQEHLSKKFDWDFNNEEIDEEDLPTVVQT